MWLCSPEQRCGAFRCPEVQHVRSQSALFVSLMLGVQVILANKAGGITFVSMEGSFMLPFPWQATHLAVSCISSDCLAVVAKNVQAKDDASKDWLHVLEAGLDAQASWCATAIRLKLPHRCGVGWKEVGAGSQCDQSHSVGMV
jgi:hypothetical protein